MKKIFLSTMLALAILATAVAPAFATTTYAYTGSAKKVMSTPDLKDDTANSFTVKQVLNVSREGGVAGGQVNYGARKTKTTSGNSIVIVINMTPAMQGTEVSTTYVNNVPQIGEAIYLVVSPRTSISGGWKINGEFDA